MPDYTVTTNVSEEEVLQWEATNRGVTTAELVTTVVNNFLAERRGHYDDPREVLKRLTPQEINVMLPETRDKLGVLRSR